MEQLILSEAKSKQAKIEHEILSARQMMLERLKHFHALAFHTINPTTKFLPNWHIDLICEYLEACYRKEIKRLIINVPPRTDKTGCVSIAFPAWCLAKDPSYQIMSASYDMSLSLRDTTSCRRVIESDWYQKCFPEVQIRGDQNTKSEFLTTMNGGRFATSVCSGSAVGRGASCLLIDDAHAPNKIESDVQRQSALDWFDRTFSTRLNSPTEGVIIVIGQRIHENDICGHLLARGGWEHLKIPMISEKKEIFDFGRVHKVREEGEFLHKERFGERELEIAKRDLGSYGFAGQMQQRPTPAGGGMIKAEWFPFYDDLPDEKTWKCIIDSWDTAYKPDQLNDPSACITFLETKLEIYILDVVCKRMEFPELEKAAHFKADESYGELKKQAVLVEDKGSGQSLIQNLKRKTKTPIIPINPISDKVSRVNGVTSYLEYKGVHIPRNAKWVEDFLAEMIAFPLGAHDDRVDALSQGLSWLIAKSRKSSGISSLPYEKENRTFA